ncbi:MAG: lysophospholipid acyltransferase family protein [Lautropia sp.]|nr:lysophospholipid acyltransferase family protein [Lautropia sp.]
MTFIRRSIRLGGLLILLCVGLFTQILIQPWLGQQGRRAAIRHWSRGLMWACGVRVVEVFHPAGLPAVGDVQRQEGAAEGAGQAVRSPAQSSLSAEEGQSLAALAPGRMLVANHVSWLDIFAINALAPSAFVAKAEIRQWPVVGWLVAMAGTIFIERGRRKALAGINQQLHARLASGYPVAFFPEATTHAGPDLKPFHGNLLAPAITEGAEIIPIGLRYTYPDGTPGEAAWFIGDTTFLQSIWAITGARRLIVTVHVLPPVSAAGWGRQPLADELRGRIGAVLGREAPESGV